MSNFHCERFVEDTYKVLKNRFGLLADVGAFEHWLQFEMAGRFLETKERYGAEGRWQVACDAGRRTRPDLDIWRQGGNEHFLIEIKILWNNGKFLHTVDRGIKDDIKKLKNAARATGRGVKTTGMMLVFPVFYCGDPEAAHEAYGRHTTQKRLRSPDESADALIDRLLAEFDTRCRETGVDMVEPKGARWYTENWCGTLLRGCVN